MFVKTVMKHVCVKKEMYSWVYNLNVLYIYKYWQQNDLPNSSRVKKGKASGVHCEGPLKWKELFKCPTCTDTKE